MREGRECRGAARGTGGRSVKRLRWLPWLPRCAASTCLQQHLPCCTKQLPHHPPATLARPPLGRSSRSCTLSGSAPPMASGTAAGEARQTAAGTFKTGRKACASHARLTCLTCKPMRKAHACIPKCVSAAAHLAPACGWSAAPPCPPAQLAASSSCRAVDKRGRVR